MVALSTTHQSSRRALNGAPKLRAATKREVKRAQPVLGCEALGLRRGRPTSERVVTSNPLREHAGVGRRPAIAFSAGDGCVAFCASVFSAG